MNKIRAEQHVICADTKAELELGLTGVRKALGVLRDCYGSSATGAPMLQAMHQGSPSCTLSPQGSAAAKSIR
jgi:hypothetical protein